MKNKNMDYDNGIYTVNVNLSFDVNDKELFDKYFQNRNGKTFEQLVEVAEDGLDSIFGALLGEAIGRLEELEKERHRHVSRSGRSR